MSGWNDEVKTAVRRTEAAWKVLAGSDEEAKERCIIGNCFERR